MWNKRRQKIVHKNIKKSIILFAVMGIIMSLFTITSTYANDEVLDTFYVLDEQGNPQVIEVTKQDIDQAKIEKESQTYQVIAFNDEERYFPAKLNFFI